MMTTLCLSCFIQAIILLLVANGVPVLANKILGKHGLWPVDNNITLSDGQRLFGDSKTWRGLCLAILLTALVAAMINISLFTGALFGFLAMTGDLLASFSKRRLNISVSSRARGLDTSFESLLPTALLKDSLGLGMIDSILIVIIFFMIEEFISPILYRWHIRKRPY